MQNKINPSRTSGHPDIEGIVAAVRAGDDHRIDRLLRRFVDIADLPALFALRAALAADPPARLRPKSVGTRG
jgi:hypothetical protein